MKKLNLLLAAVATLVLVSCVNEQFDNGNGIDTSKDGIGFYFGNANTRSAEAIESMSEETGVRISLGTDQGTEYILEESIVDLNALGTRGTPIYTENIVNYDAYKSFDAVTYLKDGEAYDKGNGVFTYTGREDTIEGQTGPVYIRYYSQTPWPDDEDTELFFYLKMPTDYMNTWAPVPTGSGSEAQFDYNSETGGMTFKYTSPNSAKAVDTKDILLGSRSLSKNQYKTKYNKTGAPVTMYHALTGVKFRTGADNTGSTKTIITGVKFTGLKASGTCTFDPTADEIVTWVPGTQSYNFTQSFANPTYDPELEDPADNVDGSLDYKASDKVFGASWYAAGKDTDNPSNTKNLNTEDGSWTFWFVPQEITDDVKLEITFCIKTPDTYGANGGGVLTHTIDFGKLIKKTQGQANVKWKAGELRTYTLNPEEVDVEIFDTMEGRVKNNLHVTNTGNVQEYVRMLVIGNWYGWETEASRDNGDEPSILVGYTTNGSDGTNDMVDPWFRGHDVYGTYFDPTFQKGVPSGDNKWLRGDGGYYYPDPIGPGDKITSGTSPLFVSYTWPDGTPFPTIYIPTNTSNVRQPAVDVHLIMEVVIQAISANKSDGTAYSNCWAAWTDAVYPDGTGSIGPKS